MNASELQELLEQVARGRRRHRRRRTRSCSARCARSPFEDLGFARVDHHRAVRQGFPEVVLGLGKTPAQIAAIAAEIVGRGSTLLVTRATAAAFEAVRARGARRRRITPMQRVITLRAAGRHAGQRHDPRRRRRHVGPAGRGRGGVHGRADGQRRRRGCTTSASPGCTGCSASASASQRPASSSSSPAWKARCRASSPGWSACR